MTAQTATRNAPHIPIVVLGWSLGGFLAITFTLCVAFDLLFPAVAMNKAWLPLSPWVSWISISGFLLGLAESFLYGGFGAVIFAPLFNFFARIPA
jgi:alpha-beta hydrolase superfamily lysophospholipase